MTRLLLVDNGSTRPRATMSLRSIATRLSERLDEPVDAVSLQHADRIPSAFLDHLPAETLPGALRRLVSRGHTELLVLPLFFGPSQGIFRAIPNAAVTIAREVGPFSVRVARPLCPLPGGEPRLAAILLDHIQLAAKADVLSQSRVLLVDHGSPSPSVTQVRNWLATRLQAALGEEIRLAEAVMERRPGAEFDFNGMLLEEALRQIGAAEPTARVILAMLFLSAGRHAGPDGDIQRICEAVRRDYPGLQIWVSPLVGNHPALIDILASRRAEAAAFQPINLAGGDNADSAPHT